MKKINTALLSYGMSGKVFHAPFLQIHEGFELVGAWERSQKAIQQDYCNTKSYDNLDDLLKDNIDLVIVNTPVHTHFEYAKKALLAGKHTLVEKAFTTTVAEAQELHDLAKKLHLKLAVFQNRRWDSDFKTVKSIFEKGVLGEIVEAEFHFDRYNPNLSAKSHKETVNAGAGILKDLGPHLIDQALYLFGFPNAIFADIRMTRSHSLVDDCFDILMYYDNFRVRLKSGFFIREALPAYVLHGKKGSFLKPRGDVQEADLKLGKIPNLTAWGTESIENQGLLHTEIEGKMVRENSTSLSGNYYAFFDELYFSIIDNKPEPVSAQDGIKVMKIIEAALQSNATKKAVVIND
jgi:scyllo-inositol 2-dehydrogenase (NADP+)